MVAAFQDVHLRKIDRSITFTGYAFKIQSKLGSVMHKYFSKFACGFGLTPKNLHKCEFTSISSLLEMFEGSK